MRPVAILCNGNSLREHAERGNLAKIPCETIGLNRSWELHESTYQVMIDPPQWAWYREQKGVDAADGIEHLITSEGGPGEIRVRILNLNDTEQVRWSWDPYNIGAWLGGSVTWVALQIAVAMRKNPIFFLGLDLQSRVVDGEERGKFWGGPWPGFAEAKQREHLGYAAGLLVSCGYELINVVIRPEESRCEAFPKKSFDEAFRGIQPIIAGDGKCSIGSKTRI